MQGVVIAFAALYTLLLLLLFLPVRVRVRAALSVREGTCVVMARVLLLPLRAAFHVRVLAPPCGTVDWVRRGGKRRRVFDVRARGSAPPVDMAELLRALRLRRLAVRWTVGMSARPDRAAAACGALCTLAERALVLLPCAGRIGVSAALLPGAETVNLEIEGIAAPIPAEIIGVILRGSIQRREKKRYGTSAGNHHAVHHGAAEETG